MYRMKGVIPPMITPFQENGDVDYQGLKTLVSFLKDNVDGLFITGSYGSTALLLPEERKKIAEITMETVDGKIPVIVHVGTADTRSACDLAKQDVYKRQVLHHRPDGRLRNARRRMVPNRRGQLCRRAGGRYGHERHGCV